MKDSSMSLSLFIEGIVHKLYIIKNDNSNISRNKI